MDLDELARRLGPFCAAKYQFPGVEVFDVHHMPGHAGFAYGFSVQTPNARESWFIRLPPPNVNWRGTADVLRQVEVLSVGQAMTSSGLGGLISWYRAWMGT